MSQMPPPLPPPLFARPVMALNYGDMELEDRRPGALVTIGAISILAALISALLCVWLANTWRTAYSRSIPPPPPSAPAGGPTPIEAVTPHRGDYIGARGMKY